jgi:hypothetical protein
MSFLQPALLVALPLVALPIIIHLINQRRYQTIRWGAMMFLLAANRMSRGYARIRQWLIMAARMLAIAGLIFAVSRPLAGGWLGLTAGGRPETTILLIDRSPSMRQNGGSGTGSKLETGLTQLSRTLETLGASRRVLIEAGTNRPREIEVDANLSDAPGVSPMAASADIPAMLEAARDYIQSNKTGTTEIWICSDLRDHDWNAEGGRWQAIRDSFREFPQGIRFHLLAYSEPAPENLSIRVTGSRLVTSSSGTELLVSLQVTREGASLDAPGVGSETANGQSIPIHFEVDGARSEVTIEMSGPRHELKDHRIPVDRDREKGWGRVSIPADANPADNDFWFVFGRPAPRRTIVVADDARGANPLVLAASVSPDPTISCSTEVVSPEQLGGVEWNSIALLLWQGPFPGSETDAAKLLRVFVERGGRAIFFPPKAPDDADFLGVRWTTWTDQKGEIAVENWRGDQGLLAHTQSGAPLPVGQLQVKRHCGLAGPSELTPLATLRGGDPLLSRIEMGRGAAYFCTSTPAPEDSSLSTSGVVFYVLVQRALAEGAVLLERARQLPAGPSSSTLDDPTDWKRVAGGDEGISTEPTLHDGVYESGERLVGVNRPDTEDRASVLADQRVDELFRGLDFSRVDDRAGNLGGLIQEIWRLFLVAMIVSMLVEAGLCLPRRTNPSPGSRTGGATA